MKKTEMVTVKISDDALIEAAKKGAMCFDAQNLGSISTPIARMGVNEKGELEVIERYDE